MSDVLSPPPTHDIPADAGVAERLTSYRRAREQVERSILPLATSVDGAAFDFQASLHGLRLRRGGYVVLEGDGQRRRRLCGVHDAVDAPLPDQDRRAAGELEQ